MTGSAETRLPIPGRFSSVGTDIFRARILVVDDMAVMRKMITMTLERAGFTTILDADDGDTALDLVAREKPDIVILDLNMPRLNGYEVCRRLRSQPETAELPILVQSAAETAEERVEVFEVGATDFVSKPINQPELLARVSMHLENRFLINSLNRYASRVSHELELARAMQGDLLPSKASMARLNQDPRLNLEARYEASSELGGDLWSGWRIDDDRLALLILDVAGHGVASALNTFRVHASFVQNVELVADPINFIERVNAELCDLLQIGQFATMLYGILNTRSGEFSYVAGGAPQPAVVGPNGVRFIDSSGLPFGISKSPEYELRSTAVTPGEALILYSDVFLEAKDKQGTMIGEAGFSEMLRTAYTGGAVGFADRLYDALVERAGQNLADDLTLVVTTILEEGA